MKINLYLIILFSMVVFNISQEVIEDVDESNDIDTTLPNEDDTSTLCYIKAYESHHRIKIS